MHVVSEKELIAFMDESSYKPMTAEELINALGIEDVKEIQAFFQMLNRLEKEGSIVLTRKHRYGLPKKMGLIIGRLQGHPKGFGFVIPDDPTVKDVHISLDNMKGAMHNDKVMVRPNLSPRGQLEGEVVRILERANKQVVGTFEKSKNFGFVVPDDPRLYYDIFVPLGEDKGASNYDKVVVEITRWPEKRRSPEGRIVEIIGRLGDPGVDILSIVKKFRLPTEFPEEVLAEVKNIPQEVTPEEIEGRRDLRSLKTVTIDGADAKDLDDAVSIELLQNGSFRLGVHIADVAHYVKEGSALDREAFNRGTSVYLVDRVIPMLPPELSNGICSLNAGVDRLALTVMMEVDREGRVVNYEIFESVINVDERMTYDNVRRILVDQDKELMDRYREFLNEFKLMEELCLILKEKRKKRGAVDFDFPEGKAVLDSEGRTIDIIKLERSIAENIIEEFMILANETVAEHMYWLEVPFIYRIHEEPDSEDISELNSFLRIFGYKIKGKEGSIHPGAFQEIVEKVKDTPQEKLINTVLLRSMKHARYDEVCVGHFGLASKYYTHFTSPIRRYPDLAIHRVIKETLKGKISKKRYEFLKQRMPAAAEQSSIMEQVAEEAERDCLDMKKAEYMKQHLGSVFTGVISSVLAFGFFVELPNTVEGLVHVSTLTDDYYTYLEDKMILMGQHTKKMYRIGDEVKVQVARVDVDKRQIDFELVN